MKYLVNHHKARPTINHRNDDDKTALWYASGMGRGEVVMVLLEAGADPTLTSDRGKTPMDIARQNGHHHCLQLLEVRVYVCSRWWW